MKIGIISPTYEIGGASMVASYMGECFSEAGHEVFLIAHDSHKGPSQVDTKFYSIYREKKMEKKINKFRKLLEYAIHDSNFTPNKYIKKEIDLLLKIIIKEEPQLVIFNTFIPMVLFTKILKERFPNIKLITWMHSDPNYSKEKIAVNYIKEYEKNFRCVDAIVCLNEEARTILQNYNPNVITIYNPLILEGDKISDLSNKVISFTSRYDIQVKGFDYLCDIANNLPSDWVIRVAGDGSKAQREELQEMIRNKRVEDKIILVGNLSGEELIEHYLTSSVFMSTSRTEGLPLVMIEAISYGLPIISFDHNGGKEILDNGKYGIIISSYDTIQFSKRLIDLINNKGLLKAYQQLSLIRSSEFKVDSILSKWENLFKLLEVEDM